METNDDGDGDAASRLRVATPSSVGRLVGRLFGGIDFPPRRACICVRLRVYVCARSPTNTFASKAGTPRRGCESARGIPPSLSPGFVVVDCCPRFRLPREGLFVVPIEGFGDRDRIIRRYSIVPRHRSRSCRRRSFS